MSLPIKRKSLHSFTLVELLVVVAIMGILAAISIPAFISVARNYNLTVGGGRLVDQLNLARQTAISKNCQVEFRFYQLPDPTVPSATTPSLYRAFQVFSLDKDGAQTNAVTKVISLPSNVTMVNNTTVSSLLPSSPSNPPYFVSGSSTGNSVGTYAPSSYNYMAFHFKADGSTDLTLSSTWFVSLANQNDAVLGSTGLPKNFYTVQLDPQTGHVRSFRPN